MKRNQFLYFGVVFLTGVIFVLIMNRNSREELITAPIIRKKFRLEDIHVKKISFERNGLYLNDTRYNSGGISSYSKFHFRDTIFSFDDISTPFILRRIRITIL
ncbi:hypothetical protein KJK34_12260 [Flavobacterium sp. D11R37]|uniref:hypothetical protein n=1 Tax=Flavobacterium coralii TaxID=2838017 RepID=UPI001CA71760|nr:hypothetical protein [Flavobacterium coralii]MBY8963528.1 hypothetical protein [Flavobacterium coralii]